MLQIVVYLPSIKLYMIKTFLSLVLILSSAIAFAQEVDEDHDHEHCDHENGKHDHFHTNELGISFAPVYFTGSKATEFGLHGHYVRRLGESRFGAGLGVEYIFNEAKHQTYSAVFQYSPTYQLHLVAAPGFAVESEVESAHDSHGHEEEGTEAHGAVFALHLEAVYEFHVGPIDIGPSIEWAWDKHETHLSAGVHVAFPF